MKISLKAVKVTSTESDTVVKLEPSLVEPRSGDIVAGELFLTTSNANMVMSLGDTIEIDFTQPAV